MSQNKKPLVSLQRCESYDPEAVAEAIHLLLEPLGGMKAFVKPGDRVLLKPNLIVGRPPEKAVTTHPEVVRAVAREAIEAGAKPFIGDSPAFGHTREVARVCGMSAVADELGMEIADLGKKPRPRPIGDEGPFRWAGFGAEALEADAIVNLPKVKAHTQMGMSLGLKNLFGAVAGKRKAFFHLRNGSNPERFGNMLVAVARYLKPVLTVEDGIVSLERDGPIQGDPRETNFLAASSDTTAADRVVLEVLGVDPESVPYMVSARKKGLGASSLEDIEVLGETIQALRVEGYAAIRKLSPINFSLPRVAKSVFRQMVHVAKAKLRRA